MNMETAELADKRAVLTVVAALRAFPWVLMQSNRDLRLLVARAVSDSEAFVTSTDRKVLVRGIIHDLLLVFGQQVPPEAIEAVLQEVTRQVDERISDRFDDGLTGTTVD